MSPRRSRFYLCHSLTLTAALVLTALAVAAPAHASEQVEAPAAEQGRADKVAALLDTAVERFAAGDLEAARESFAAAWRLRKDVTIASNLADVEMKLGRYRDAAEHLSFCIRHATDEGLRKEAARRLAECRPFVGSVSVTVDTPVATVLLDGAPVGHAPIERELWLAPGRHTLQAQHEGRASATQTLQIRGSEELKIELKLSPSVGSAAAPTANAGHTSTMARQSQKTGARTRAATSDSLNEDLKFYSIVGGSILGGAALGAGLLWTLDASSKEDSANALRSRVVAEGGCGPAADPPSADCGKLKQAWESYDSSRNLATGAFIAGGVLIVGTIAAYIFWPEQHESPRKLAVHVAPFRQGNANGVQLSGSF